MKIVVASDEKTSLTHSIAGCLKKRGHEPVLFTTQFDEEGLNQVSELDRN